MKTLAVTISRERVREREIVFLFLAGGWHLKAKEPQSVVRVDTVEASQPAVLVIYRVRGSSATGSSSPRE